MCLGIPGKVVEITNTEHKLGMVDVSGVLREVNLTCVCSDQRPIDSCVGEWVLIHVGFAMSLIDEAEAEATLKVLEELGSVQEELMAIRESERS